MFWEREGKVFLQVTCTCDVPILRAKNATGVFRSASSSSFLLLDIGKIGKRVADEFSEGIIHIGNATKATFWQTSVENGEWKGKMGHS